jgi:hypothetical protein
VDHDNEQTSAQTHQWYHNAAQQCPSMCGLQRAGPTDSQVMAGAKTSCIQPRITAMQSSDLRITEALEDQTFMSHRDVQKNAVLWFMQVPSAFFLDGIC